MKTIFKIFGTFAVLCLFLNPLAKAQTFKISPNGKVLACDGDTIQLEAVNGFAKYGWSTGSTNRVIQVTKSGTYICGALDSKGNVYADSAVVTFYKAQKPTIGTNPKNAQICSGDSLVIEVNKGFAKYSWNAKVGTRRMVIYPTTSGYIALETVDSNGCRAKTYVQYSVKSCSGTTSCKGIIGVYPDAVLCGSHDSVRVEVKHGYSSYLWNDSNTSRLRTLKKEGWFIVTVTDSNGNKCSDSLHISDGVNPLKVYSNTNSICPGDSAILYFYNQKFDSIKWVDNKSITYYAKYAPTKSRTYVVYAWDSNGCVHRGEYAVTVKDTCNGCGTLIEATKKSLCGDKDSVKLEAKSGFLKYIWSTKQDGRFITVKSKGWYYLTVLKPDSSYCVDSIYISAGGKNIEMVSNPKNATICKGDSIALEGTYGFKAYDWSISGVKNHNGIKFKPTESVKVYLDAIDENGCVSKAYKYITVKDTCNGCGDLIEASKTTLCGEKDSIKLQAKYGFLKYFWSTKQDGRYITVKAKGWYYLAVLKSDSTVCYDSIYIGSGGKNIEIFSNPKNAIVCKGDSIELEATYGFKSYSWTVNGVKKSNGIKFKPNETMKVWVEGVDENGCVSKTYLNITVKECNHCPKIIEPWPTTSLCKRDSIILEAKNGYKSYNWSTGKDGRLLVVKKDGWYWLDFKDSAGNVCRDSIYITSGSLKEIKIKIYPDGKICKGDTIVISATEGFKSYSWNTGSKSRLFEYVADKTKEIVVEATDSNGCEARIVYKLVVENCGHDGLEAIETAEMSVYPNPTQGLLTVYHKHANIEKATLYDLFGRQVNLTWHYKSESATGDLAGLKAGNYLLKVQTSVGLIHQTVIKID